MTGICMRNVTHLSSDNILPVPVNIFKLYKRHNISKEHKQVISKKGIGTSMEKKEKD